MTFSQALVLLLGLSSPAFATSPDAVTCDASSGEHCAALGQDASEEASDLAVNLLQSALRPHVEKESKQTENKTNMFWKRGLKHWGRQKGQLKSHREWKGRPNRFSSLRTLNKQESKHHGAYYEEHHGDDGPPECMREWIHDCLNGRGDFSVVLDGDCACLAAGNVSTCDDQTKRDLDEFVAGGCEQDAPDKCFLEWMACNYDAHFDCACLAAANLSTCDDQTKRDMDESLAGECEQHDDEHHGGYYYDGPPACMSGWILDCLDERVTPGNVSCACFAAGNVSTCDDQTKRDRDEFVAGGCEEHHEKKDGNDKHDDEKGAATDIVTSFLVFFVATMLV